MNTSVLAVSEIVIASTTSTAVALSINVEPLITALITFGISLITVVGGELIKFLVAFLKKKKDDLGVKEEDEKEGKK